MKRKLTKKQKLRKELDQSIKNKELVETFLANKLRDKILSKGWENYSSEVFEKDWLQLGFNGNIMVILDKRSSYYDQDYKRGKKIRSRRIPINFS